jgi:acylphosphatase
MDAIIQTYLPHLLIGLCTGVGALLAWGQRQIAAIVQANVKNKVLQGTLALLNDVTLTVVAEANQTVVEGMKQHLADGKVTPDEYRRILHQVRDDAVKRVLDLTGEKLMHSLGLDIGQARQLVVSKVEAMVPQVKAVSAAGAAPLGKLN